MPKAKHCFTKRDIKEKRRTKKTARTNSPYVFKWNSRFSRQCLRSHSFVLIWCLIWPTESCIKPKSDFNFTCIQSRVDHIKSRKPKQSKLTKWNHELIILEDNTRKIVYIINAHCWVRMECSRRSQKGNSLSEISLKSLFLWETSATTINTMLFFEF